MDAMKTVVAIIATLALLTACDHGTDTTSAATAGSGAASPSGTPLRPAETIAVEGPMDLDIAFGAIWTTNEFLDAVTRVDGTTFEPRSISLGAGFSPQEAEPFADSIWVSGQGGLVRLDPANGEFVTYHLGSTKFLAAGFGTLLSGGRGHLDRIDPSTGALTGTIHIPTSENCLPSVAGGAIWVSCGSAVRRVDPETNRIVATLDREGRVLEAGGSLWLVSSKDILQVARTQNASTRLARLDAAEDRIVPGTTIVLARGASSYSPRVVHDTIWFPMSTGVGPDVGKLIEFDGPSGRITHTFDLSEQAGYGYNSIAFGYGSAWTASFLFDRIARWFLPHS
jgi:hypothetical protein